ncbi:MAG TPA: ketosynthase chain-length factor [Solirubrobacteraceae bacterium]|nr:ketosynthase chain-length factor [Solirubrobacteraceae bacterium]
MSSAIVTGVGVIAPSGTGTEAYWTATLSGKNAIGEISRFDSSSYPVSLAGEVRDFDAAEHIESRLLPQTDHMTRMALVASDMALADAGVDPAQRDEYGVGVVSTNCYGGWEFGQREMEHLWATGPRAVSVYESFAWFYAVNTGQISIRHRMRGHCGVLVSEEAGGLDTIAAARRQVRLRTPLMLTGGMEAPINPWTLCAQIAGGRLSTSTSPDEAYRPFDVAASGHVPAEGGAILVVESPDSARRRGRNRSYAEVAGYAATFDPRPGSDRPAGLRRAADLALADAGVNPEAVDVVFADASGTPELDRIEAEAIAGLFGPEGVAVTAPKTMTGRMYGGGASVDVAAALLSLRDQVIPPTINVSSPAPGSELRLVVDQPQEAKLRTALVLSRGYGGFNSALVLRAV